MTPLRGDAQQLPAKGSAFDIAILNLILSVLPDGHVCLRSALRPLKLGKRQAVFNKFQPDNKQLSRICRALNFFSTPFGTDITRRFIDIAHDLPCESIKNGPSIAGDASSNALQ